MNSKVVIITSKGPIPRRRLGEIRTPQCMLRVGSVMVNDAWKTHWLPLLNLSVFITCPTMSVISKLMIPKRQSEIPIPSCSGSFGNL